MVFPNLSLMESRDTYILIPPHYRVDKENKTHIGITHIYREANKEAEKLSKEGIREPYGYMNFKFTVDNTTREEGLLNLL